MKTPDPILYKRAVVFLWFGLIAIIVAVPIISLRADERASKSVENSQSRMPATVPQIPEREHKLFSKMVKLMKQDKEAALKLVLNSLNSKNSAALYFITGDLLQQNGYTVDALEHFHVAIEKYPDFYIALRSAGVIETHLGNFEEGRGLLLRAHELMNRPDHVVFGSLGQCEVGLGEFESAELYYRDAIKLNLNYRGWKTGLAKALHGQAKHEEANAIMESLNAVSTE